jgi:glutamyl-tRNA reductase
MELFAVGLNYQSAPLALRERLAFSAEHLQEALRTLTLGVKTREAAILSTCNRTEVYCASHNNAHLKAELIEWLAINRNISSHELSQHVYLLPQQAVMRHAFRVASGLDSMVLGEAQILGQMKQAARSAKEAGTLGPLLHQLFQRTFSVAKEVRSQTEIGAHSVSMASAAVKLASRIFGDLSKRRVLLIGAGEMIQLCATHFAAHYPKNITIANRSPYRAHQLAQAYGASVIGLAQVPEQLAQSDIVISCTASTLPLIGLGMVEAACKKRKHEPMFMLDLAVPRDIEEQVSKLEDIFLYTVDDLSEIVNEGREHRAAAIEQAEAIIENQVQGFMRWVNERSLVPIIQEIQQQACNIAQLELEHARKQVAKGSQADDVLKLMANRMSAKFMHGPMQALHQASPEERDILLKWLPQLFNIKNIGK